MVFAKSYRLLRENGGSRLFGYKEICLTNVGFTPQFIIRLTNYIVGIAFVVRDSLMVRSTYDVWKAKVVPFFMKDQGVKTELKLSMMIQIIKSSTPVQHATHFRASQIQISLRLVRRIFHVSSCENPNDFAYIEIKNNQCIKQKGKIVF